MSTDLDDGPGLPTVPGVQDARHRVMPKVISAGLHTSLAAVDIMGFGSLDRDEDTQLYLRQAMYTLLAEAFDMTFLPWRRCHREDRGDGALIIAPATVDSLALLDPLAHHLNALLRRHNRIHNSVGRLRLRLAVHTGHVHADEYGVAGHAVIHLFRLLDSIEFKQILRAHDSDLGLIVSDRLHTEATRRGGLINPAAYREVHISHKETRCRAWLWLPPAT